MGGDMIKCQAVRNIKNSNEILSSEFTEWFTIAELCKKPQDLPNSLDNSILTSEESTTPQKSSTENLSISLPSSSSSPSPSPKSNNSARKRVKTNVPVLTQEQRYAKERDEKKKIKQKLNKNSKTNVIWTLFDEECEKMGISKSPVQSLVLALLAIAMVAILGLLLYNMTTRTEENKSDTDL